MLFALGATSALAPGPSRRLKAKRRNLTIMLAIEFEPLSALGLTPALANRAAGLAAAEGATFEMLRVTVVHRSTLEVHDGRAERGARPLPRLVRALTDEGTALAVGDWVLATRDGYGETWVEARVPPSSHVARRDGDGRHPSRRQQRRYGAPADGPRRRFQSAPARTLSRARRRHWHRSGGRADQGRRRHAGSGRIGAAPRGARRAHSVAASTCLP